MAIKSMWWHANLSELQLRARRHFAQCENDDRIVIGPPVVRTPSLNDLLPWPQHKIDAGEVASPDCKRAAHISADFCPFPRERCMLLGIHYHFVDFFRSRIEYDGLPD